jgi:hypothetical protein
MPQTFGSRTERRAFSRAAVRHFAAAQHRPPEPVAYAEGPKRKLNRNRAERRKHGWRGNISALMHGKHDTAWLYSGTLNASGQARINTKRHHRAEFWRTVRIRVSNDMEPYFRASLHLLGAGTRIDGRTELPPPNWFTVDLDVHIPGAPADAVRAEPVYRSDLADDGRYEVTVDHIEWFRADHTRIDTTAAPAH